MDALVPVEQDTVLVIVGQVEEPGMAQVIMDYAEQLDTEQDIVEEGMDTAQGVVDEVEQLDAEQVTMD